MDPADELRHLREGPRPEEPRPLIDHIVARCSGNADAVLRGTKEVLESILRQDPARWPADEAWSSLLPRWFVQRCAPEKTKGESDRWLTEWRSLPEDERVRVERDAKWSVLGTVYWFRPEMRSCWWWDGIVEDQSTVRVAVAIGGLPYAAGALEWILRASGAAIAEKEV